MNELQGKTAIVTGGSRGYGRGMVEALASAGTRVIAVARDRDTLAALAREVHGSVEVISADVTSAVSAARIIQRERPEILVLSAGSVPIMRPTRLQTWETFSLNWDVDVKGVFTWAREALLLPLESGSTICVISSTAAESDSPEISGYASAKAALWRLSQSLAAEARSLDRDLRVRCMSAPVRGSALVTRPGVMPTYGRWPERNRASPIACE